MDTPPTPVHPAANEEVASLPTGELPQTTLADIDLNPDLYDSDYPDSTTSLPTVASAAAIGQDSATAAPTSISNTSTGNRWPSRATVSMQEMDSETSFQDVDLELKQFTFPFDEGYAILRSDFDAAPVIAAISNQQQSKLVNYIDENLLQIQRKFIRNQTEVIEFYSFSNLLAELEAIVNLLWTSIHKKNELFGQVEYYIKLLGDLEDYLSHYESIFDDHIDERNVKIDNVKLLYFFTFFQKIDLQLSVVIDGYVASSGKPQKANSTQLIRIIPIVSRLRVLIVSKLEPIRIKLNRLLEKPPNRHIQSDAQKLLNLLELEVSRLFEGILDRSF
ncbi:predicted protein [Scheffersomyces stipitis CBS 6054]|uniref:Uncharacterized protein n=1 Tax=Scheffersomyces stipitis (strain ATCC 58785 / CBS 6054 / NBRC 10063 / NRRL Y-11545) TaxID=322104 RepID=A3LQ38_PICST|nr:predicted protein [Scheffersomyces stipitis CBS 6054]ABN65146.2 predicted protein [Scheffersomyces stipitis CBS 6054]KAG2736220.1 hypothetical protein G9P44_000310 [Scheffersomyces stipitis]